MNPRKDPEFMKWWARECPDQARELARIEAEMIRLVRKHLPGYRVYCAERGVDWPTALEAALRQSLEGLYDPDLSLQENLRALDMEELLPQ